MKGTSLLTLISKKTYNDMEIRTSHLLLRRLPMRLEAAGILAVQVILAVAAVIFTLYTTVTHYEVTLSGNYEEQLAVEQLKNFAPAWFYIWVKYLAYVAVACILHTAVKNSLPHLKRLSGLFFLIACALVVLWPAADAFPGMPSLTGMGMVSLIVRCLAIIVTIAEVVVAMLLGLKIRKNAAGYLKTYGCLLAFLPLLAELSTLAWYAGSAFADVLFYGCIPAAVCETFFLTASFFAFKPSETKNDRTFIPAFVMAALSAVVALGIYFSLSSSAIEIGDAETEELSADDQIQGEEDSYDPEAGYSDGTQLPADSMEAGDGTSGNDNMGSNTVDGSKAAPVDADNLPEGDLSVEQ